jgi:hypothetical protein
MSESNFPSFDSITFNRVIHSNELQSYSVNDLYLMRDELTVVLNDLIQLFKNLPNEEKSTSLLRNEIRDLKIFEVTLKRVIYAKNKSEVEGLRKCLRAWKNRALILGAELGFTKADLKQLVEVQTHE